MLLALALTAPLAVGQASLPQPQPSFPPPALVILEPTGEIEDGLPVLARHPAPLAAAEVLTRGFSGRLLRLFAMSQEYLRRTRGKAPQPAYLAFTGETGGFPRTGFVLEGVRHPDAGWVDLRRTSRLAGYHGAIDQIFPHELLHVIALQLAGPPVRGGSTQIHALGVRTDPSTAFHEGLAEHAQVMAIDDPDAAPGTAALRADRQLLDRAEAHSGAYARDLKRAWWPVARQRLRFPLWYNSAEQVRRYYSVKSNDFGRRPQPPEGLTGLDAYFWRSVIPPPADALPRSAAVQLSIDGPVAHLFWRLATDSALAARRRDAAFYAQFGTTAGAVTPLDNVYLKIFAALDAGRPHDTAAFLRAWMAGWPDDAPDLERLFGETIGALPSAPALWLANDAFHTGTTVFDQYRSLPRLHTFDANAAEDFDWLTVPGVSAATARALVEAAPFTGFDALVAHPAVDDGLRARVRGMADRMAQLQAAPPGGAESLSLFAILKGYLWRLAGLVVLATVASAWATRRAGAARWWSALLIGLGASVIVSVTALGVEAPVWFPVAVAVGLGGVPWALVASVRRRRVTAAGLPIGVWLVAALPAALLTAPW